MSLNNIQFNYKQGGLGRQPRGNDHISGMVFFTDAANPSGTASTYWNFLSSQQAEDEDFTGEYLERIEEYFRMNPNGNLFVQWNSETDDDDKIRELQNFAGGKIRQCLVVRNTEVFSDTLVGSLQDEAEYLRGIYRPTQFLLEADFSAYTASDIRAEGRRNVSVILGNDTSKSWSAASTALGVISRSKLSDSIAHVAANNIQGTNMYQNVEILGEDISEWTDSELADLQNKGFITLRTFTDFQGVYFTDSDTADSTNSDYAFIEVNRVIDGVARLLRVAYLPDLSSPAYINPDGTLSLGTIGYFSSKAENILNNLENNREISLGRVSISPSQNVLSTGVLEISIDIIPVGINRNIKVNLAFATNF